LDKSLYKKITPQGSTYAPLTWEDAKRTLASEWSKIRLIIQSEMKSKVFEKALGVLFLAIEPIFMAFVYYFLTQILMRGNMPSGQFLNIYIAVVFWRWLAKTVDGSPVTFASYASVLKQTNFSVFSLIIAYIGVEFAVFLVALIVLFIFATMMGYPPHYSYIYLVFPMVAQLSIMLFLTVLFATAGAFVRDLAGGVNVITGIWFYLSPGIYPVERIPEKYLAYYYLNPFAHILPAYRDIILRHELPPLGPLLLITVVGLLCSFGALRLLGRARRHFFSFI
jgi:lipopolysaccharide transport system permease protein